MKESSRRAVAVVLIVGMLASVVLAAVLSFYAGRPPSGSGSTSRDGGSLVAEDAVTEGAMQADYADADGDDKRFSTADAGLIGIAITVAGLALLALFRPRASRGPDE